MNFERKVLSVQDRKVHALLFAHSFETKIGFGFGLASYLKTQTGVGSSRTPHVVKISFYAVTVVSVSYSLGCSAKTVFRK